jgi:transposase
VFQLHSLQGETGQVEPMTMTTSSLLGRAHDGVVNEPDSTARPTRRTFTAAYKAAILEEYDSLPERTSERGALLRREGLYTSHLSEWRRSRDAGVLDGLAPKPKARRSAEQVELERLRRHAERLEVELERTRTALEITGKVHALLEQLSESAAPDPKSKP